MDFNEKIKSVSEKISQLKKYREQVIFYNTNKNAFENPQNSIKLEDNVAFISPLNDIDKHLEENSKTMALIYDNKGFTALKYICYGMIITVLIIVGILIAHFFRGV